MNLEGGCSCGAIRYKLTNSPLIVHACHCRDCQRVTGSGFVINIWIEKRFVESSGATPKSVVLKGGTGKDHEAFFCDNCGTYVWSRYQVAPGGERCSFAPEPWTLPTRSRPTSTSSRGASCRG